MHRHFPLIIEATPLHMSAVVDHVASSGLFMQISWQYHGQDDIDGTF